MIVNFEGAGYGDLMGEFVRKYEIGDYFFPPAAPVMGTNETPVM